MLNVWFGCIFHGSGSGSALLITKPMAVIRHTKHGIKIDAQYFAAKRLPCMQLSDKPPRSNMKTRLMSKSQDSSSGQLNAKVSSTAIVCMKNAAMPHVETRTKALWRRAVPAFVVTRYRANIANGKMITMSAFTPPAAPLQSIHSPLVPYEPSSHTAHAIPERFGGHAVDPA